MLKAILPDVLPCPNHIRHEWARWDAYIYTLDPDALFDEFKRRGASFVKELSFIDDGLWGFEVTDADGYVLAFFRPAMSESCRGVAGGPLDPVLSTLAFTVARLQADQRFVSIEHRVAATLERNSRAPQAWEPLPAELFESGLPDGIRSCWIFRLRAGGTFGAERHPNSHQRSVALGGVATFELFDGNAWVAKQLCADTLEPLRDSWISIPAGQWHRIRIGPGDFTSCSFHTATAEELVEETPVGDDLAVTHKRLYDTSHP